jgi:hypothetical protein
MHCVCPNRVSLLHRTPADKTCALRTDHMLLQYLSVVKSPHAIGCQFSASLTAWYPQPTCDTSHARTPCSVQGDLTNMDSGDALGDVFFASRDRWLPLACTSSEPPGECHMTEVCMRCKDRAAAASDLIRTRICASFFHSIYVLFFLIISHRFILQFGPSVRFTFSNLFSANKNKLLTAVIECRAPQVSDPAVLAVSQVVVEMDMSKMGVFKSCNLINFTRSNAGERHNYTCDGYQATPPPVAETNVVVRIGGANNDDPCASHTGNCGDCTRSKGDGGHDCLWCLDSHSCHSWDQKPTTPNACAPSRYTFFSLIFEFFERENGETAT